MLYIAHYKPSLVINTPTESIESIGRFKFKGEQDVLFGDHLLSRIQLALPDRLFVGVRRPYVGTNLDFATGALSGADHNYRIKEPRGPIPKVTGRTVVELSWTSREVSVFDPSLRDVVEESVQKLNTDGNVNYQVIWK